VIGSSSDETSICILASRIKNWKRDIDVSEARRVELDGKRTHVRRTGIFVQQNYFGSSIQDLSDNGAKKKTGLSFRKRRKGKERTTKLTSINEAAQLVLPLASSVEKLVVSALLGRLVMNGEMSTSVTWWKMRRRDEGRFRMRKRRKKDVPNDHPRS